MHAIPRQDSKHGRVRLIDSRLHARCHLRGPRPLCNCPWLLGSGRLPDSWLALAWVASTASAWRWPPSKRARVSSYVGLGWQAGVLLASWVTPMLAFMHSGPCDACFSASPKQGPVHFGVGANRQRTFRVAPAGKGHEDASAVHLWERFVPPSRNSTCSGGFKPDLDVSHILGKEGRDERIR